MVPSLSLNSKPSSLAISDHFQMCGNNSLAEKVYYVGMLLTKPFLYQLNLGTKTFGNKRPGKSFEELTSFRKLKKIVKIATFYTVIIPLVTAIVAAIGFLLRLSTSFFRPAVSLIDNHAKVPFKTHTSGEEIVFMTYNTAFMPGFIRNINDMRSSKTRAKEIGKAIQYLQSRDDAPDIICLQECFDSEATSILCDEHAKGIYPHIIYNVDPNEYGLNSGLVILSKFEINEICYSRYTAAKGEDALAHKGVLGISINIGRENCWVYNTHLQSKDGQVYEDVRDAQIVQLQDTVASTSKETLAFVLGDFNKSPVEENGKALPSFRLDFLGDEFRNIYQPSIQGGKNSTWYAKGSEWGTSKWKGKVAEGCVLDYIFIKQIGDRYSCTPVIEELAEVPFSGMSDHLPLCMRTNLRTMLRK